MRAIDSDLERWGDQRFAFIVMEHFSGAAGEPAVVYREGYAIFGGVKGDGRADFSIRINGASEAMPLVASDFVL